MLQPVDRKLKQASFTLLEVLLMLILSVFFYFLYIERKTILFFLIFQSLAMDDWIRKEITHSSPVI